MKRQRRTMTQRPGQPESWHEMTGRKRFVRTEMNIILRSLMILLLILLIAAICLAGYAVLFPPVVFTFKTQVLSYEQSVQIDYLVLNRSNPFTEQASQGMDLIYLKDYTQAVDATFKVDFRADQPVSLAYRTSLKGEIQVCDPADPALVMLAKPVSLAADQSGQTADGTAGISESVKLDLDEFRKSAEAFVVPEGVDVRYNLAVYLDVSIDAALPVEPLHLAEKPVLLIPLDQPSFRITRQGTGVRTDSVSQMVRYKLTPFPVAFAVYPATAGFCLLLLLVILIATRGRRKPKYAKDLRRMKRLAGCQLVQIGDKAWEPEWCIKVSNFVSMVRTAKKLKHPIFCYEDLHADRTAAYFYAYFGENNFCYMLTGQEQASGEGLPDDEAVGAPAQAAKPSREAATVAAPAAQTRGRPSPGPSRTVPAEPGEVPKGAPIPLLPETDRSSEILF